MSKRGWAVLGLVAAITLVGCASDDWQAKYEEQQRLNLDLAGQNDDLKTGRAEQAAKIEAMGQQVRTLDKEAQAARDAAEAAAKQGAQPGPAAPPGPTGGIDQKAIHDIAEQLKRELGSKAPDISVTKDGNIEITLASDVTFSPGSAELSDAGKKSVRSLAGLLKGQFAPYQVRVEGHTDSTPLVKKKPIYSDNFGLGSARSLAVVRFMESDLAIEPTRLMSASRGEHEPVADNKSDSGKKRNRRVEIVVVVPHDAALSMAK